MEKKPINLLAPKPATQASAPALNQGQPQSGGLRVLADSFVTLHFKISLADADGVVADTFEGQPATLQLGTGQFSQPLEHCLIGVAEGESIDVVVEPDGAYGIRNPELVQVILRSDAFAPILRSSALVLGMAGTAVEQAVGLGKPVVQIPGRGPQFTYAFAEAQMRLLGPVVYTVGQGPAGEREWQQAATLIQQLLADPELPARCAAVGLERVGAPGGSRGIAAAVLEALRA